MGLMTYQMICIHGKDSGKTDVAPKGKYVYATIFKNSTHKKARINIKSTRANYK